MSPQGVISPISEGLPSLPPTDAPILESLALPSATSGISATGCAQICLLPQEGGNCWVSNPHKDQNLHLNPASQAAAGFGERRSFRETGPWHKIPTRDGKPGFQSLPRSAYWQIPIESAGVGEAQEGNGQPSPHGP
jgi:hypothetical protein